MGTAGPPQLPYRLTDFHCVVAPESVEGRRRLFLGNIFLFFALHLEQLFLKCGSTAPLFSSKGSCTKCGETLVPHCNHHTNPGARDALRAIGRSRMCSKCHKTEAVIPSACPEGCSLWVLWGLHSAADGVGSGRACQSSLYLGLCRLEQESRRSPSCSSFPCEFAWQRCLSSLTSFYSSI